MYTNRPSLVTSWVVVQKICAKMHLVSCTNTRHNVTYLVNNGMVKNTKTSITWERNITFLQNKKILNLCFRWHILTSYDLVVEVTFNVKATNNWDIFKPCFKWNTFYSISFLRDPNLQKNVSYIFNNKKCEWCNKNKILHWMSRHQKITILTKINVQNFHLP